jgi:cell division protein FtsQ
LGNTLKIASVLTVVAIMSCAFVFAYDLLTQSSFFSASDIQVSGFNRLSRQEIVDHAGIHPGKNIFAVNLTLTRDRLKAHPWIEEAEVRREIPSGVSIHIKEYEPLAIIDMNHRFLIDRSGEIFKKWDENDPWDLPVIAGLGTLDLKVGDGPFSRPFGAIMEVLKLGRQSGCTIPIETIHTIEVDRDIGLTIHMKDRAGAVHLGYYDYPSKYELLEKVLVYFQNKDNDSSLRSIDLNNPNRIVVNIDTNASPATGQKEV